MVRADLIIKYWWFQNIKLHVNVNRHDCLPKGTIPNKDSEELLRGSSNTTTTTTATTTAATMQLYFESDAQIRLLLFDLT